MYRSCVAKYEVGPMHIPFKSIGILLCFSGPRLKDSVMVLRYSRGQDTADMATPIPYHSLTHKIQYLRV